MDKIPNKIKEIIDRYISQLRENNISIENAYLFGSYANGKNRKWTDVPGLCKVATLQEIEAQGWSLNPGRYVGVGERPPDDFVFAEKLEELNEELETLNLEAHELEERIGENVAKLLEGEEDSH